jgi:hypothetical protein
MITKPPMPAAMSDNSMALVLSFRQADPSGQSHAGKSYVVFGKKDNTPALETERPL